MHTTYKYEASEMVIAIALHWLDVRRCTVFLERCLEEDEVINGQLHTVYAAVNLLDEVVAYYGHDYQGAFACAQADGLIPLGIPIDI